jgi:hypothetical protein
MKVHEAKDFLVEQVAQQAAIEGVPLSDLEKRMMYYAEGDNATPDDSRLNDEFDAKYDTAEYEAKFSLLLHHAHVRAKKENPETARQWDEAIRLLRKGDHYISILWGLTYPKERPPGDAWKLLGTGILVVAAMFGWLAWVDPRIDRIKWLSSALHVLGRLIQTARIVYVFALVVLILLVFLARFLWLPHSPEKSRKGQDS